MEMQTFTLISLAFLSSFILGCASSETKSVLEERAGYGFNTPGMNMNGSGGVKYVPSRVPEQVVVAWLHGKDLPSKDYFWGSWLSLIVEQETWEMKKVDVPKSEKKQIKRTQDRPINSRPKKA
jgi:hypothetical protein